MVSYFNFYDICTYQQEIKFSLIHYREHDLCFKDFDSHRFTRCYPFWFLNHLGYHPVQFCFRLLGGNTCIHVSCYLFFCIFKSSVLAFCRNYVFWFLSSWFWVWCLVYSYPKMFLLFFSLIFISRFIYKFLFVLLLDLGTCRVGVLYQIFPSSPISPSIFNLQWMLAHTRGI